MREPDVPANEGERQAALDQLRILDTPPEERFDRLTRMAARLLDAPIAVISLIDRDRQWFKSCIGLDMNQTPRSLSFCGHAILDSHTLVVEDTLNDERFHNNPVVLNGPKIRFYAGKPILSGDGHALGTLCVLDHKPRKLNDDDLQCLEDIAACVEEQISARALAIQYRDQELQSKNESVIMLKQLVDLVPGGLYQFRLFPDGRMTFPFSSKGIEHTFGITQTQAQDDAALLFAMIEPEDYPAVVNSIKESSQHLSTWNIQFRIRLPEDSVRWIEGHSTPQKLSDGSIIWHGFLEDIDDKKRALVALEESEQHLRRLFELAPSGIILADYRTGEIIDVNNSMLKSTGYKKEEFLKLGYRQLLSPEHKSLHAEIVPQLQQTGHFGPIEREIVGRNGSSYPAIIHAMLIRDSSGRKLLWVLLDDISERKKIESMKNQFVSTVSHELRTPLTSITGAIGLLSGGAAGELPQKAQDMMAIAERNAKQLARLIDDLLDIEKLVAGKLAISLQRQALLPLLEQAVSENQAYGAQREITLHLEPDIPTADIFVDCQRLLQGLGNLISNAIKFSPDKGHVYVSAKLEVSERGSRVTITVQDSGTGVPEAFRNQIFQRFAQADSSDTRSKGGTGLGLAITRELISVMGGEVGFESLPNQGATFWIRLPVAGNHEP
ncbi:ATP-binding protein [Marinobacter salexigens]|uniref:ATP-binding protein n=1 Tax=Marinobacter salexigens TaxID=1925763 RepID=UPI000C292C8F|nr:ATP-binding protein [Marinobacter salexigens]